MIVIGIILSFVSLGFLCWLLFALAVQALPVFVAFAAGLAAYHIGSGEIGAFLVALIAGAFTLAVEQIAVAAFRSPVIRTAIALVFAVPAAMAGYHAALGLAQLGVPAELWQQAFAVIGAVAVGATAWARLALLIPPDAGRGDVAGPGLRFLRPQPGTAEASLFVIPQLECPADVDRQILTMNNAVIAALQSNGTLSAGGRRWCLGGVC